MTIPPIEHEEYRTPGQLIQDLLASRGWTARVLAIVLNIDETVVNKMINGKRPVDAPMALLLNEAFGIPAERFLELQKSYDLAQARIVARPDPNRLTRAYLFGDLPVTEMIKRGWLDAEDIRETRKWRGSHAAVWDTSLINPHGDGIPWLPQVLHF